jgi:hypothetical protein
MSTDDRLRRALRARADRVEPGDGSWEAIQAGVASERRRRQWRTGGFAGLAAVAVIGLLLGALALVGDDPTEVETGGMASSPTTTAAPPETTTPTPVATDLAGIWPFTSQEAAASYEAGDGPSDGFHGSADVDYTDPEATALDVARTYLGFPDPVIATAEETADADASAVTTVPPPGPGRVVVRSQPDVPMTTTLNLEQAPGSGAWYLTSALADNIPEVRWELSGGEASVSGTSTAFEGTVQLELRQDGMAFGDSLGGTFATGGSMGEMGPFEATFGFRQPSEKAGALIVYTDSAKDGTVQEATAVRVQLASDDRPAPRPPTTSPEGDRCAPTEHDVDDDLLVTVFFTCEEPGEVAPTTRVGSGTSEVLRSALEALLAGPTSAEEDRGFSSWFSDDTADALAGVSLTDGRAIVDLDPALPDLIPNASTSAGSASLLAELNATVFQFGTVDEVEYRLGGGCDAFFEWLQSSCTVITRADAG